MADQGRGSDLGDLKIALQVMSHDGLKLMMPALATLVGVCTCSCLFIWSFLELQKFSPESIALSRIETPPPVVVAPIHHTTAPSAPVAHKAKKIARKPVVRPRRLASRYRPYDEFFESDNPTGGRVTRSSDSITEYTWDH